MLDVSKLTLEEVFYGEADDPYCSVAYFICPKEIGDEILGAKEYEEGRVVAYCVSVTVERPDIVCVQISPTVEAGDSLSDIDWHELDLEDVSDLKALLDEAGIWW